MYIYCHNNIHLGQNSKGARTNFQRRASSAHSIDLAIRQGFDGIFYTLLYPEGPQTSDEPPEDIEKLHQYYTEKIREARSIGTPLEQVYFIDKAASLGIEQENYLYAATLLNAALAIAKKEEFAKEHLNYLYSKLERVEGLFLYSLGIKTHEEEKGKIEQYQEALGPIREKVRQALEEKPIREVLETLTDSYKKLFAKIIEHSITLLGKPPTNYAFIGLGSMARGEMCPYSDIEFIILVNEANETTLPYFEKLCKLIQLKNINIGETPFKAYVMDTSSTPNGFCLDEGDKTPIYNPDLIGTPEQIAAIESYEYMERAKHELQLLTGSLRKDLVGAERTPEHG